MYYYSLLLGLLVLNGNIVYTPIYRYDNVNKQHLYNT